MKKNDWLVNCQESGIRKYMAYAKDNPALLDFTIGDTYYDCDDRIKESIIQSINKNETHYTANAGSFELRKAIAEKENNKYSAEEILVTFGATEGIYLAISAVINPEGEIILLRPNYSLYESVVQRNGGIVRYVDAVEEIDLDELILSINEKTSAIVINVPCNPTGSIYKNTLGRLVEIAKEKQLWVIWDAAYEDIIYDDNKIDSALFQEIIDQLIIVRSFSKSYAMTGLRVGYVLAKGEIMKSMVNLHKMCVSCPVTVFSSACITALMNEDAKRCDYQNNRNYVCSMLEQYDVPYIKPLGTFFVCIKVPNGYNSITFVDELIKQVGIICVPGRYFGMDNIIRMSFAVPKERLIKGIERLCSYISASEIRYE